MRLGRIGPFVLAVAAMTALTSGPLYRLRTWFDYDDPLQRDPVVLAIHGGFAVLALVWLLGNGMSATADRTAALVAAALAGWLLLTTLWSIDRDETLIQTLGIAASLLVGVAAASALGPVPLRRALWVALHLGLAWSTIAIERGAPGSLDSSADWVGIFFNRNSLALYAALGVLVSLFVALDGLALRGRWRVVQVAAAAVAVLADVRLLAGSDALTPLAALVLALLAGVAARLLHGARFSRARLRRVVDIAGIGAIVVGAVAWLTRGTWLDELGRDSDLTGRSELWSVSVDWAWRRPVHGFGYLAPWQDAAFSADVVAVRGELLGSAHSSFVDTFLGAGLLGVAALVALVVLLYRRHAVAGVAGDRTVAAFGLVVLVFVVVEHLAETLLVGNQLVVALFGALLAGDGTARARS